MEEETKTSVTEPPPPSPPACEPGLYLPFCSEEAKLIWGGKTPRDEVQARSCLEYHSTCRLMLFCTNATWLPPTSAASWPCMALPWLSQPALVEQDKRKTRGRDDVGRESWWKERGGERCQGSDAGRNVEGEGRRKPLRLHNNLASYETLCYVKTERRKKETKKSGTGGVKVWNSSIWVSFCFVFSWRLNAFSRERKDNKIFTRWHTIAI